MGTQREHTASPFSQIWVHFPPSSVTFIETQQLVSKATLYLLISINFDTKELVFSYKQMNGIDFVSRFFVLSHYGASKEDLVNIWMKMMGGNR